MKSHLLLLWSLLIFAIFCQGQGWRKGEMELKIHLPSQTEKEILHNLNLNGDVYADHARIFVTPEELKNLKNTELIYEILIYDLNAHYQDFWEQKDAYHSYQEIIDLMDSLATFFPDICIKYDLGLSIEDRELAVLKISDNVDDNEYEPEVLFDGGIHGDEIGGAENLVRFARKLCLEYGDDPEITDLIDNREIWIYPMVNPDGRANMVRYNAAGVDLNRDWGYMWDGWGSSDDAYSQIETQVIRDFINSRPIAIHTTFHSGMEGLLYPWCHRPDITPDDDLFDYMTALYSSSSGYSNLDYVQSYLDYPTNGEMIDFSYGVNGILGMTMEISSQKQPPASQIMYYYDANVPSMIEMIINSGFGIEGTVSDANTGETVRARIYVDEYFPAYNDPETGDYHKFVLPGTYSITASANGYASQTIDNVVVSEDESIVIDFQLELLDGQYVYKFAGSQIPGNNFADEGYTPAALGPPDNITYSLGKSGWCILDLQYPVLEGSGFDFKVFEGDESPEGYTCYAGETLDGPWISLGDGWGTTEFDLATSGLTEARFLKIVDDGDGSANVADAGFDLDGIEVLEAVSGIYLALFDYAVDDSNGNNNGMIDPDETVDIIVTLQNNGDQLAEDIQGEINSTSPYLTLDNSTADFGTLAQGESGNASFTITALASTPAGEQADIDLFVSSNEGTYENNYTISLVIGHIPVLILDLDGNNSSAPAMAIALQEMNISFESSTSFPYTLSHYSSIFLCLGVFDDNHVLTSSEGQMLADYLVEGGKLYMEGGDTWFYDNQTAVHSLFNIDGVDDGAGDLSDQLGQTGTFTEGMVFNYSGDNNWIDQIEPIDSAFMLFANQSPDYGTVIAHDAGSYKTIGASHEFGGLEDGTSPSTKNVLMAAYLDFFQVSLSLQALFYTPDTEVCEDETIDFTDLSNGDIISWEWIFEGGNPSSSSIQQPTVTYENEGIYDVTLTVSDGSNTNTLTIEDYITVNSCTYVGEDNMENELMLFPNPSDGLFWVRKTTPGPVALSIRDIHGVLVKEITLKESSESVISMDLSSLSQGIYFISVRTSGFKTTQKIIIY